MAAFASSSAASVGFTAQKHTAKKERKVRIQGCFHLKRFVKEVKQISLNVIPSLQFSPPDTCAALRAYCLHMKETD